LEILFPADFGDAADFGWKLDAICGVLDVGCLKSYGGFMHRHEASTFFGLLNSLKGRYFCHFYGVNTLSWKSEVGSTELEVGSRQFYGDDMRRYDTPTLFGLLNSLNGRHYCRFCGQEH